MSKVLRLQAVVLCALLGACASPSEARLQEVETPATEVSSWEEACADERSLTVMCAEDTCAFVRCRDVQGLPPGDVVVQVRGGMVAPAAPGAPRRWWGRGQGLPGEREPVFIIPWNTFKNPHRTLPDMRRMLSQRPWVLHHIFPQEPGLATWFKSKGIDIHQYTIPIPQSLHTHLHSGGPYGGMWNQAWREFVRTHQPRKDVPQEVIWRHAFELMVRHKLTGPFVPYR